MCRLHHQVHDTLVNQEGMDASSDAYYTAIEQRVKDKFADKWDHWQKVAAEAAATAAAAEKAAVDQVAAAQAAAQAQRVQQIQALRGFNGSPVRASQNYTSFRVPLKDATPGGVGPSGTGEQDKVQGGLVCLRMIQLLAAIGSGGLLVRSAQCVFQDNTHCTYAMQNRGVTVSTLPVLLQQWAVADGEPWHLGCWSWIQPIVPEP
jgi:hypothetical protein